MATDHNPIGIPAHRTHSALQTDAFKEIVNKLAWALGTTYRTPYRNIHSGARLLALDLTQQVIELHGWPPQLAKE